MSALIRAILIIPVAAAVIYGFTVLAPHIALGGLDDPAPLPPAAPAGTVYLPAPPAFVPATYQGHTAEWWARQARAWHQQSTALRRTLLHKPDVAEAINLACTIYGNCPTLWRKARCESKLYRYAANARSSARGLFQFLTTGGKTHRGTWGTTPFASFSVFSPYANALAAGWMHANGRGGEWVCS